MYEESIFCYSFEKLMLMQKINVFYTLIIASVILSSCASETANYLAKVPTDITLYSEFSTEDAVLHRKLYDYFNLECSDGSSMSVVTPMHLDVRRAKEAFSNSTQYKIVIGNNIYISTILYLVA